MTSILLDASTKALLATNDFAPAIVFVNDCTLDTLAVHAIEAPNYQEGDFLRELSAGLLPKWTWTRDGRKFVPTPAHVLTTELVQKSRLASVKARTFNRIADHLSRVRYRVMRGVEHQDIVHLIKLHQAEGFRAAGYDERRILEFPYVLQYAEFKDISLKQATDDIIIKASFDSNYLLNTEALRLKYMSLLRRETSVPQIERLRTEFKTECYQNTLV